MDEYIFRGKTNSGNWIFGNLVYSKNIQPAIYFETGPKSFERFEWAFVKLASVGIGTNVFDKHGKQIFAGDIVKWKESHWRQGVVSYRDGQFYKDSTQPLNTYLKTTEIIGNTFDNPNLIK